MNISGEGIYTISGHADWRIYERQVTPEQIHNALYHGRAIRQVNGCVMHYDNHTGVGVVASPVDREIITVMRLKRRQVKQYYSK